MKVHAIVLAVAMFSAASAAQATTLFCTVDAGRAQGGWISPEYLFQYDLATGAATALDGIAKEHAGGPVAAKLAGSEDKKVTLAWNIGVKSMSGQLTKMQYRASWFPAENKVIVRGTPGAGYRGNFEGRGTCEIKK